MLTWPRLRIVGVIAQVATCSLLMQGCDATSSTSAPSATAKSTTTELDDHGKPKAVIVREATATGVSTNATGDSVNQKSETESPTVAFDGMTASGGAAKSSNKADGSGLTGASSPLLWVGIACLLFAGVAVWQGWKGIIIPAAASGVVFLALAFYPWLLLWGVCALVVIVGGPYIWQYIQGFRAKEALRAVVSGVAAMPPEQQVQVQAKVSQHASDKDKATIRAMRRKDNITMASDVPGMVTQ